MGQIKLKAKFNKNTWECPCCGFNNNFDTDCNCKMCGLHVRITIYTWIEKGSHTQYADVDDLRVEFGEVYALMKTK